MMGLRPSYFQVIGLQKKLHIFINQLFSGDATKALLHIQTFLHSNLYGVEISYIYYDTTHLTLTSLGIQINCSEWRKTNSKKKILLDLHNL